MIGKLTTALIVTPFLARVHVDDAHLRVRDLWLPPPAMSTSQWADTYRMMPKGTTSRPGRWVTESYQREIMDVFDDPKVHKVVFVKPTQVGWSEILNNIIGKRIHLDPKPMKLVQPSLDGAREYGKKRITPMFESCPELKARVKRRISRQAGSTLLFKEFLGGWLSLTGANSGKGLRSDPVSIMLYDERDGYPDDVDGEGDPVNVGDNRLEGYADWKSLEGSTPAKPKGLGAFEKQWLRSDQRRFHVPCPHCGHEQVLWWRDQVTDVYRLVYELDENGEVIAPSVAYICAKNGCRITENHKGVMLRSGRWIATYPGRAIVGFHINGLYRPWKANWAAMAQRWADAHANGQTDYEQLKDFITLQLAEWWEEKGTAPPEGLKARREQYVLAEPVPQSHPRPWEFEVLPARAALLTCSADVQGNRIEAKVKAWADGEESWLVAYEVFWGDPSADPEVWAALDGFRRAEHKHASGKMLRPIVTLVDSGDQADAVYDYVLPRQNLRDCVFASKGVDHHATPVLVLEGTAKRSNVRLFTIATHPAKDRIFARMRLAGAGPGRMHWPKWATDEYFDQLTSEKSVQVRNKKTRVTKKNYVKTHDRNEGLDNEVGNLAALWVAQNILDPARLRDLDAIARVINGEARAEPDGGRRRVRSAGVAA